MPKNFVKPIYYKGQKLFTFSKLFHGWIFFKTLFKVLETISSHPELTDLKSVQPFGHNRNLKILFSKIRVEGMTRLKTLYKKERENVEFTENS